MPAAAINNQPRSFQSWPAPGVAVTPNDFNLDAGVYGLSVSGTFGTATLRKLMPDGVTYLPVSAAIAANTYVVLQLPAGQYQMTLAGMTLFIGEIALIARGGFR